MNRFAPSATKSVTETTEWQVANQRYLMAAIAPIRQALEQQVGTGQTEVDPAMQPAAAIAKTMPAPPALEQLCQTFRLSDFERDMLLLCVGMEIDSTVRSLCLQVQADIQQGSPTFSLAGAMLKGCHWGAFTPDAPLRAWRLIEVDNGSVLMTSPLRVDEQILHYLMGKCHLDEQIAGLIKTVQSTDHLVASHQAIVEQMVTAWWQGSSRGLLPIVQLCGGDRASKRSIATAACDQLGLKLCELSSHALPTATQDLRPLARMWEREALLNWGVLLLHWDETHGNDVARENAIAFLMESITSPLVVMSRDRRPLPDRPVVTLDVPNPTTEEQRDLWYQVLGHHTSSLNGFVEALVSQFNLSPTAIQTICHQAVSQRVDSTNGSQPEAHSKAHPTPDLSTALWQTCRTQARPRLDDLAQRIDSKESWDDLILPKPQKQILQDVEAQVRQRSQVYERWGFAGKGGRGLGISALFSGTSGTGKTMAAGVLAQRLSLDLYRIDLSAVVSKYIGETEKNLGRVFDAAESGGVVLLFDEADALFGKRSEVKDSHDRYANMEVSYLLQRMEAYRGLAILTTNLKEAIDPAFMRRIRFIVRFPFPEYSQRVEIWQRVFPRATPTEGLNVKKLANLNIAGGNIRNIALNAAFLAANEGKPVTMMHLRRAAEREYIKVERTLTDTEVQGWV